MLQLVICCTHSQQKEQDNKNVESGEEDEDRTDDEDEVDNEDMVHKSVEQQKCKVLLLEVFKL